MQQGDRVKGGFVVLGVLLWSLPIVAASADELLDEIRFSGNRVTDESVLRQEMVLREGSPYGPERVEKSRQAIMNLGLFKSVEAEVLQKEGKNVLLITVEERFYILPIPLLSYRPDFLADETATNYSYGGELRFDNLFGLNQRLKLSYEETEYEDDAELPEKESEFFYSYPRLIGTPYRLDVEARIFEGGIHTREDELIVASTELSEYSGSFFLSRWLNPDGLSEGWRAGGGLAMSSSRYRDIQGESGYADNDIVSLQGSVGYFMVDDFPYHQKGQAFTYSAEVAHGALGSDQEYFLNTINFRRYQPLNAVDANINTQLRVSMAFGDGSHYRLGSSTSLRGYESGWLEGNFLLLGNFEYHHHVSGYRQLRGVLFMDAGNVWPELNNIDNNRLYTSVGLGMRWRVQSFVDVTLRADYAYNTHTGETETYLATSGSF